MSVSIEGQRESGKDVRASNGTSSFNISPRSHVSR